MIRENPAKRGTETSAEVPTKIHSLANVAAARATCQPAAAARRSQARRGAHPLQNAGVHLRPRLHVLGDGNEVDLTSAWKRDVGRAPHEPEPTGWCNG